MLAVAREEQLSEFGLTFLSGGVGRLVRFRSASDTDRVLSGVFLVVAARRVKSCFVERKQLPERFKKGKEDHDRLSLLFPPYTLSFFLPFSLSLAQASSSSPLLLPSLLLGPVFHSGVDGAACSVVSGACLQFL